MKCLQENIQQPDFGVECIWKLHEMMFKADFQEDYSIATTCGKDIDTLCKEAQVRVWSAMSPPPW